MPWRRDQGCPSVWRSWQLDGGIEYTAGGGSLHWFSLRSSWRPEEEEVALVVIVLVVVKLRFDGCLHRSRRWDRRMMLLRCARDHCMSRGTRRAVSRRWRPEYLPSENPWLVGQPSSFHGYVACFCAQLCIPPGWIAVAQPWGCARVHLSWHPRVVCNCGGDRRTRQ